MTETERIEKRERFLGALKARRSRRPLALNSLPELALTVRENILVLCPECNVEIVSTSPEYVEDADAVIEVWDVPADRAHDLNEKITRYLSPIERESFVTILVLFHEVGELSGLYGRPHPELRRQTAVRSEQLATT